MADRDEAGRFLVGSSGNRAGRPRGFRGAAAEIMRRTDDGRALIDYAIQVWQDSESPPDRRWAAFCWLSDRGWGRAVSVIDAQLAVESHGLQLPATWDRMTALDRAQWIAAIESNVVPPSLALPAAEDE